jgi:hypothetical protein
LVILQGIRAEKFPGESDTLEMSGRYSNVRLKWPKAMAAQHE